MYSIPRRRRVEEIVSYGHCPPPYAYPLVLSPRWPINWLYARWIRPCRNDFEVARDLHLSTMTQYQYHHSQWILQLLLLSVTSSSTVVPISFPKWCIAPYRLTARHSRSRPTKITRSIIFSPMSTAVQYAARTSPLVICSTYTSRRTMTR